MSHRREYGDAMQMRRECKRCSAYASRYHRSKSILIDLMKFHSRQTILAPFRARVLQLAYGESLIARLHNHSLSVCNLSVVPFDQESSWCPDFTEDLNRIP